ncbi:MAG: TerB family tellurite resistance protein [Pseudomonadota bacterium]
MLNAIKDFFEKNIKSAPQAAPGAAARHLRVATAALLIEMMRTDYRVNEKEQQAVLEALQTKFGLDAQETAELFQLAEQEARLATDYHQFTSLINKNFSAQQKEQIIEHMWEVAYADGDLDKYEEHLVRKIAELLYVSHAAFIRAKHRAFDQARGAG